MAIWAMTATTIAVMTLTERPKIVSPPMKSQRSDDIVDIWTSAAKFTTRMS